MSTGDIPSPPPFNPLPPDSISSASSPLSTPTDQWTEVLLANCHFGLSTFLSVLKELCLHPERNSGLILRADPLPPKGIAEDEIPVGMEMVEELRLRLMPRQPQRDGKLDQRCLFFKSKSRTASTATEADQTRSSYVIYVPESASRADQPFYYPPVRKLAYRYETLTPAEVEAAMAEARAAELDRRRDVRKREEEKQRSRDEARLKAKEKAGVAVEVKVKVNDAKEGLVNGVKKMGLRSEETEREEEESIDLPPFVGRISMAYLPWDDPPVTPTEGSASATGKGQLPQLARATKVRKPSPLATHAPSTSAGTGADSQPSWHSGNGVNAGADTSVSSTSGHTVRNGNPSNGPTPESLEALEKERVKLYRISHNMLERVYKHGFGLMVGYKKRVNHDVVVPRDSFQDLYLTLKERHRHLDSRKANPNIAQPRVEDVKRHVFKDVAIAAFLMLLWKDMYPSQTASRTCLKANAEEGEEREWDTWGRPSGGFADLGCGNGLLVHILTAEGYEGKGYELRARRTWPTYPPSTRANLVELPIEFPSWFPSTLEEWDSGQWAGKESCGIKDDCFIIGNHADEITPWIPLLSLIPSTPVPFLSLPCCAHTLDAPFCPTSYNPPPHPNMPPAGLDEGLESGQSKYKAFLMYLGHQGLMCGWEWEKEGLRIPSTRGWGIVGRKRWTDSPEQLRGCREWALEQVEDVRKRGTFKVRVKEGNDH